MSISNNVIIINQAYSFSSEQPRSSGLGYDVSIPVSMPVSWGIALLHKPHFSLACSGLLPVNRMIPKRKIVSKGFPFSPG